MSENNQNNQNQTQAPPQNIQGTKKFKWTRWIIMGGLLVAAVGIFLVFYLTNERIINPSRNDHFDFTTLSGHTAREQLDDARNRPLLYDGKTVFIRGNYPVGALENWEPVHRLHLRCGVHRTETFIDLRYAGGNFPSITLSSASQAQGIYTRAIELRGTFKLEGEGANQRFFILVDAGSIRMLDGLPMVIA